MRRNRSAFGMIPFLMVATIMMMLLRTSLYQSSSSKLDYNGLMNVIEEEEISEVSMVVGRNTTTISGKYKDENDKAVSFKSVIPSQSDQLTNVLDTLDKSEITIKDAEETNVFLDVIIGIIPWVIIGGVTIFMLNRMTGAGGKQMEATRSRAKLQGDTKVRFKDVAGCDEEKEEMQELVEYLRSPKKFTNMGAKIPRGILMVGPPGTGKTLLARAVAGEANVPFYSTSGSDFVELFVGAGSGRVRDMFKKAKQSAPCMIFIDEIDAVARQRGAGLGGGHDEKEQTLNQLLVEMDGIEGNTGVIIIAATNRPDILDPALLRPGRIDRQITVGLPDRKGREEILGVHAIGKKMDKEVDFKALAKRTPGFSGADLANILNEAAILAVREKDTSINMKHLDEAIDRVMMGPAKKSKKYDEKSKKLVAYHESGHAVLGLFLEDASTKVEKITIIPRGHAGGYNLFSEKEEKIMKTKKDFMSTITTYMGGRVAEEIFFDDISAGATGDIESATNIARNMVTLYGMSDLGPIKYDSGNQNVFLGRDFNSPTNVSGQIAYEIDQEIRKIIDTCYKKAHEVISNHKDDLIKIADVLLEYETITSEQIEAIIAGKKSIEEIMNPESIKKVDTPLEVVAAKEVKTEEEKVKKTVKKTAKKVVSDEEVKPRKKRVKKEDQKEKE
ncbi:MAG: ATP-dependent zinc metalloprotease FtsH [Anaerorhabdus sp.]